MKKYDIYEEHSGQFGVVAARNATSALKKAMSIYPRKRSDYNLEPGEKIFVKWYARLEGSNGDWEAEAEVPAPGKTARGARIFRGVGAL